MSHRFVRGGILRTAFLLLLLASVRAQVISKTAQPGRTEDRLRSPLRSADSALKSGDEPEARRHLLNALAIAPFNAAVLERLLTLGVKTSAGRHLWALRHAALLVDAGGKLRIPTKTKKLFPSKDPWPKRLALARAQAVFAVERLLGKKTPNGRGADASNLLRAWAAPLVRFLLEDSPQLLNAQARRLNEALAVTVPHRSQVIDDLLAVAENPNDPESALEAGRILRGFASQAAQKDLEGRPAPKLPTRLAQRAAAAVDRSRKVLAAEDGAPLTVEKLRAMSPAERDAFTAAHATPAHPGRAVSPNGLYLVETPCGFETLLGVASTIEKHHRRLVKWYGRDPFEGQSGTIRVVTTTDELEREGAPYWWAGGFQGGDVTTVRFTVSSIESLGHTLTHELTHRFDGALFPGQPAWLAEGKATWTGSAYAGTDSKSFVDNYANFGSMETALRKGYGNPKKLRKLLEGHPEDYRDNYPVGHALFVYLNTWEDNGGPVFRKRFQEFMSNPRKMRGQPFPWFTNRFCDGKDGRPEDFDAFAEGFAKFIGGFYWLNRKPWTERYAARAGKSPPRPRVYDPPTWPTDRSRAEPFFGTGHAAAAARLFDRLGNNDAALRAHLFAFAVDGPAEVRLERLADLLAQARKEPLAWFARTLLRRGWPDNHDRIPPIKGAIPSKLVGLHRLLGEAAAAHREMGLSRVEARLLAEQAEFAEFLGFDRPKADMRPPAMDKGAHPYVRPARALDLYGWKEDRLVGYDKFRVKGLWYVARDGTLHVGRRKPRKATGSFDPRAHERQIFVRTPVPLDGVRSRIELDIRFTTSFVSGAVILGYERRDRAITFHFTAGDYMVGIGQKKSPPAFETVRWSLRGGWIREGGLRREAPGGRFEFGGAKPNFHLRLDLDGAEVAAYIDGRWVGTYRTGDGRPITGPLGFATSFGAFAVTRATHQRFDRYRALGWPNPLPAGLDLAKDGTETMDRLLNRRVKGLPSSPQGALVIWIPRTEDDDGELDVRDIVTSARFTWEGIRADLPRFRLPQPVYMVLPGDLPADASQELAASLGAPDRLHFFSHHRRHYIFDLKRPNMPADPMPVLMFIDDAGCLRLADIYVVGREDLPPNFRTWCRVHR
ncbi:MAG TPA: hypothetical protein ENK43_06875 [Planctomycetes bacterium]|nr:hypothetical protein [Planctomycetota bacterium]